MKEKRNSNKIVMSLGLFLFLVILPGGSWYYLQKGLNYQKNLRAELANYGEVPAFQLMDSHEQLRDSSIFSEKIAVVAFVTPDIISNPKQMELVAKIYDQFDKKDESRIVVYGMNWPADQLTSFNALAEKYKMDNPEKCFFLTGDKETVQQVLDQGFQWPTDAKQPIEKETADQKQKRFVLSSTPQNATNYPYFILINKNREIMNYYDFREEARVKTMIEHVAISIPLEKRPKPRLKREQEK